LIIPVIITVYADRSFTFVTKTPPASVLAEACGGHRKGSACRRKQSGDGDQTTGAEIAQLKTPDLTAGRSRSRDAYGRRYRAQHGIVVEG
jgi:large subunit ribosomal protein L11